MKNIIPILLLSVFIFAGLFWVRDYGAHVDEYHNQDFGNKWTQVLKDPSKGKFININPHDRVHGPFFEVVLTCLADALKLRDPYDVIQMRHLATFLLFCFGVAIFYIISDYFFRGWLWGLVASAMLVLHPRIFADAHYNSVDISFLVFYIAAFGTLILFSHRLNLRFAFLHALVCAILMDVRLVGGIMPMLTIFLVLYRILRARSEGLNSKQVGINLMAYILSLAGLFILFSPMLWHDSADRLWQMFKDTAHFQFFGMRPPPWHYTLRWIFVTTPISICVFFVIGVIAALKTFHPGHLSRDKEIILSAAILFFVPVLAPAVFKTVLFDGWRHHYFVYPFFVLFAVLGLKFCWSRKSLRLLSSILLIFSFSQVAWFMIRFHPHQCVYANFLAGPDLSAAKENGALDYWGLSYRHGIEHILRTDPRDKIMIGGDVLLRKRNLGVLRPEDRQRVVFVPLEGSNRADYLVTNFRQTSWPLRINGEEIYSRSYREQKYLAVYRVHKSDF